MRIVRLLSNALGGGPLPLQVSPVDLFIRRRLVSRDNLVRPLTCDTVVGGNLLKGKSLLTKLNKFISPAHTIIVALKYGGVNIEVS